MVRVASFQLKARRRLRKVRHINAKGETGKYVDTHWVGKRMLFRVKAAVTGFTPTVKTSALRHSKLLGDMTSSGCVRLVEKASRKQ